MAEDRTEIYSTNRTSDETADTLWFHYDCGKNDVLYMKVDFKELEKRKICRYLNKRFNHYKHSTN